MARQWFAVVCLNVFLGISVTVLLVQLKFSLQLVLRKAVCWVHCRRTSNLICRAAKLKCEAPQTRRNPQLRKSSWVSSSVVWPVGFRFASTYKHSQFLEEACLFCSCLSLLSYLWWAKGIQGKPWGLCTSIDRHLAHAHKVWFNWVKLNWTSNPQDLFQELLLLEFLNIG